MALMAYDVLSNRYPARMESGMAQKIQTLFVDDLDGSEADGTVRFGLDGTQYEIDLSTVHAAELRSVLAPYARAGRKVAGVARRAGRGHGNAAANGFSTNEVRDWAKANGLEIKDRGRVPAEVINKFRAATGK
jgi:nucleoid-associated protein Lsr2